MEPLLKYSGEERDALLEVRDLVTQFFTEDGVVRAVDGVSFDIRRGETLGMVGESGSGKSVTSLSVMRLLKMPPARIVSGQVHFEGQDLLKKDAAEMRLVRGGSISMVFQEPMTSLNPVFTVGSQIAESLKIHQGLGKEEGWQKTVDLLKLVGIPLPDRRAREFPHQMSGGMRQRVMIAIALACHPRLLIADEPTTALDVTVQAQILELLRQLRDETGMSLLLITHDLGVIAEMADRVAVMYAGKIVETAPAQALFDEPLHPYTQGLMRSIPSLDSPKGKLHVIDGTVPNLIDVPAGCRFHPRCPDATRDCAVQEPRLAAFGERAVACFKYAQMKPEEVAQ